MRRVALIVNPAAGAAAPFGANRDELLRVCADQGLDCRIFYTTPSPHSAGNLATEASKDCSLVIACGGDGTVHGVLQGVANTSACLGVLPFGTGNALARNLGLPRNPIEALRELLTFTPRVIPLGVAETQNGVRWFTVMAGAGPDGRLIHEMSLTAKSRVGRKAYYVEAVRLFLTRPFPPFQIDYRAPGSTRWTRIEAIAVMASRVPNLGGIFAGLTPYSRLHHPHLCVQALAPPAHLSLPAWLALGGFAPRLRNPWLTTLEVEELRCSPIQQGKQVFAQVDGESAGPIPLALRIEAHALRLLLPDQQVECRPL